ncbi:MAG: LamG-like jellyroll fold domain-containing protein [Planctomycetota bacterium]
MSIPQDTHDVLQAYFEGNTSPETTRAIEAWLKEDPTNLRLFAEYGVIEDMLFSEQQSIDSEAVHKVMAELAPSIEPSFEDLMRQPAYGSEPQAEPNKRLTSRDFFSAGSYLLRYSLPRKKIAVLASAAVLLLGMVLSIVLLTGGEEILETATLPDFTPVNPSQNLNRVVATVTDQVNAQWITANGQGALPDRMLLAVNQRLTLVEGFAEITTNRGAKVLVQAPASFETTDSDNAIRLHRGKLVGICETSGSKGFVVYAPGVDVVDLGTRFGVEADATKGTSVLVMEGSVRVQPTEQSPLAFESVVLEQGEVRQVEPDSGSLKTISLARAPIFYQTAPHPYVQAVLDTGPIVYWRFESAVDGALINQIDPKAYPLRVNGSATLVPDGVIGGGAWINNSQKTDGYFDTTDPFEAIGSEGDFTLSLWCRIDHDGYTSGAEASIGGFYTGKPEDNHHLAQIDIHAAVVKDRLLNGIFRVHYNDPRFVSGHEGLQTESQYKQGQWQHVVLTRSGQTLRLYIDAELAGEHFVESIKPSDTAHFVLGRSMSLPRWLKQSTIDEVAIFDRPLSGTEIQEQFELAGAIQTP